MPWLIFRTDSGALASLELTEAQEKVTVGRSKKCQICTQHPSVSRQHVQVVYDGEGITIRDLGSRNGTFFQRSKVATAQLVLGEGFHCGQFLILFDHESHESEHAQNVFAHDSAQAVEEGEVQAPEALEPEAIVEEVFEEVLEEVHDKGQDVVGEAHVELLEEPQEDNSLSSEPEEGAALQLEEMEVEESSEAVAEGVKEVADEHVEDLKIPPPPPALFDQKIPDKASFESSAVPDAISFADDSASRQFDWSELAEQSKSGQSEISELQEPSQSETVELGREHEMGDEAESLAVVGEPESELLPELNSQLGGQSRTLNVRGPAPPDSLASFQRAYGDLEDKYDTAQNRCLSLQDSVKALEDELVAAQARVLSLEQQVASAREKEGHWVDEKNQLQALADEKALENERLQGALSVEQARVGALEAAASDNLSEEQLEALHDRAHAVDALEAKITHLESEFSAEKERSTELEARLEDSKGSLEALQSELQQAESRLKEKEGQLGDLQGALEERPSAEESATIKARAERAELEASELKDTIGDLTKRVEVVEAERDVQRAQVTETKDENVSLQQEIRQLQAEISLRPSDESLAAIQVEKEALEAEYAELKQLFTNAPSQEEVVEQEERSRRLESERDELAGRLEIVQAESDSLREQCESLQQRSGAQEAALEKAAGESRTAVTELTDLHDQIENLTEENSVLARSNRQNVKRIAELMAQSDKASGSQDIDPGDLKRARDEIKALQSQAENSAKKVKELEALSASLQDIVDESSADVGGDESGDSISWVVPLFERVNDAVSQWRNDSRALEEVAKDLRTGQYTTDEEREELLQNLEENAVSLKELSEELKQFMRENRSHLPS